MTRQANMSRRSLLTGFGALVIAQFLTGCSKRQGLTTDISYLQPSIPTALLRDFQKVNPESASVQFRPVETLPKLYNMLMQSPDDSQSSKSAGMTLGDYWLAPVIRQGLIEPIEVQEIDGWNRLPAMWQTLVTRDRPDLLSPTTAWGAPYRWGSLAIVYQIEAFEALGWTPKDWNDLWNPDIQNQLSLLDSPRTVIGLTLKQLGHSFNTETLDGKALRANDQLKASLSALQNQVKTYSSSAYLQPLILEDTWVAVGWSMDILPLLRRDRRFAAVVPQSGTALTSDIWVRPSFQNNDDALSPEQVKLQSSALSEWIQFCWQTESAQRMTIQSFAASPIFVESERSGLPQALQNDDVLLPNQEIIEQSEFLAPLPDDVLAEYDYLWTAMRLGKLDE